MARGPKEHAKGASDLTRSLHPYPIVDMPTARWGTRLPQMAVVVQVAALQDGGVIGGAGAAAKFMGKPVHDVGTESVRCSGGT